MQKIFYLALFSLFAGFVNAQKVYAWMDAGAKVGYGLTGLVNTNLFDDKNYEYHLSTGLCYGGKIGLFIGLYDGVTVDALFSNSKQEFDFNVGSNNYAHTIEWKNLDLAVLYRMQKDGIYIEIGPQFSFVNKVTQTNPLDPETDIKKYYSKNYISGVFGIGGYVFNYETFTTMLGIRLGYAFTDMVSDDGKNANYPTPKSPAQPYSSYKGTYPAFVQLNLEFNFALGYYGRSACSKRSTFFKF